MSDKPHYKRPTIWGEIILFSCPNCQAEFRLEALDLIRKFSAYHDMEMYFAKCPDCGKDHIAFG